LSTKIRDSAVKIRSSQTPFVVLRATSVTTGATSVTTGVLRGDFSYTKQQNNETDFVNFVVSPGSYFISRRDAENAEKMQNAECRMNLTLRLCVK
jgi:hypothetical protein